MNIKRIGQFEFYKKTGLFPSHVQYSGKNDFRKYAIIRRNLYERYLNIPLGLLLGSSVMDLGCGTGDSAAVLGKMGAYLTLVDADDRVWDKVEANFKRLNIAKQIKCKITAKAENFIPRKRFNLITAEGFLFTCVNRNEILKRLAKVLLPRGFISISYPDKVGSFMEFLKKAAFLRALAIHGIKNPDSSSADEIGFHILGPAHSLLPNPRPFRTWFQDCIVSPFLKTRYCWSAPEIIRLLKPLGLEYYSSSPRISETDRLGWYKRVETNSAWRNKAYDGYIDRSCDFAFGIPVKFNSKNSAKIFSYETANYLLNLSKWFDNFNATPPLPSRAWFASLSNTNITTDLSFQINAFFAALKDNNVKNFKINCRKQQPILKQWGKSYHYLVMERTSRYFI